MSKVFKGVKNIIKPIAKIALPIAASFVPGIGPLGMAAAGALGGALGGGGLKGALLGGALSGLGAGVFGSAPAQGSSIFSQANNSVYNALSPLRSIGNSITGGIKDLVSPLGLFGGGTSSATPAAISSGGSLIKSLPGQAAINAGKAAAGVANSFSGLSPSVVANTAADSGIFGTGLGLKDIATGLTLLQAVNPQQPEGTLSQKEIMDRMDADRAKQDASNAKFIESLNSPAPLNRTQTRPNIDYYSYGSRPEELFFDNPGGDKINFKKGGKVNISPLAGIGGQDDSVHAKLSAGEYVIPADVVSGLGDGNTEAGAAKLDQLLKNLRKQRSSSYKKGKLPPKAKSPLEYMGALA